MSDTARPEFPATIPQLEVIRGGRLDGWAYAFQSVEDGPRGIAIIVTITQPGWPWPYRKPIRLTAGDFTTLEVPPAEKVVRLAGSHLLNSKGCAPTSIADVDLAKLLEKAVAA